MDSSQPAVVLTSLDLSQRYTGGLNRTPGFQQSANSRQPNTAGAANNQGRFIAQISRHKPLLLNSPGHPADTPTVTR
ncbi:hypothetical protein D3C85_1469330 [compost metagenome]